MTHLDEERVERFVHGELEPSHDALEREHLASCTSCRGRVADAQRDDAEVNALLQLLDHPLPKVSAQTIVAQARPRDVAWGRWAAGVLLVATIGGAAYAAPGSPLRRLVAQTAALLRGRDDVRPATPAQARTADPAGAGIAVEAGRALLIQFTSHQQAGEARITLTDSDVVTVRAPNGAATFTSDVDRLIVDNSGSLSSFEIQIPRTAPRVEVRVGTVQRYLKDGARIVARTPADAQGAVRLPLAP